jgi:endoglucanase
MAYSLKATMSNRRRLAAGWHWLGQWRAAVRGALTACFLLLAAVSHGSERPAPVKPRILLDGNDAGTVRLRPGASEAVFVPSGSGRALRITTAEGASWPGVTIEPKEGRWNLAGMDAVEADIRNPQNAPVRVLLSINNAGANGRDHCNVESTAVPARGKATLVVPFGTWHGDLGHPIDLTRVVSVQVFLDRPGRGHQFFVEQIRAVPLDRSRALAALASPFFAQLKPAFGRGINLGDALEAPREGAWGVVLKEEYFEAIRAAGFDSVRIPVRWSGHADVQPPFQIDPQFFARVDWAVRQALGRRLVPVLDYHHDQAMATEPDRERPRFLALWRQIANHYRDFPAELAFELLNEPCDKLTAEKWNRVLAEAIGVVRQSNPTRPIVVGPVGWNGIGELPSLELPEQDRHLIVTVHYYNPFHFTHQGASWIGPDAKRWLGTRWTGSPAERHAVVRDLDKAIVWAVEHRRPIYLGEFGAYSKGDLESRARWTAFVAQQAAVRKMGFAYWEFCSGFGAYDAQHHRWIGPLKSALLAPAGNQGLGSPTNVHPESNP